MLAQDAYTYSHAPYGYYEPQGHIVISPYAPPGSLGEVPPSPTGPVPVGAALSPPTAHTSGQPRRRAAVCCECWCHRENSGASWTRPPPSPPVIQKTPTSPFIVQANPWEYPPSHCSPTPVEMVGAFVILFPSIGYSYWLFYATW